MCGRRLKGTARRGEANACTRMKRLAEPASIYNLTGTEGDGRRRRCRETEMQEDSKARRQRPSKTEKQGKTETHGDKDRKTEETV